MSHTLSSMLCKPFPDPLNSSTSNLMHPVFRVRIRVQGGARVSTHGFEPKCELNEEKTKTSASKLSIGCPVIITEAPQMIKTAASVPCLRVNSGLVNSGDVGRIVSRKPMDVWAIRLSIGTYLIDRKYFKPLELDE